MQSYFFCVFKFSVLMKLLYVHIRLFTYVSDVAVDTTRLTCHYFVPVLPFLYCLDPKLALIAFS